ncbi:tetratricopeptide repeat protein [Salegentibacter salegens]|uniref:Tetratricopeptide repeat-containing protein n=1 Tax=Salegentibacter salegens TaxID=143223 RepID=A0A1M7M5E9_9FLAO|nr:tetratricopeptide repeat protein [Salegentibacter salegens]PRX40801.1 tetratricopeptide repeat protein [Salegentibacter salegens]SHM85833.1 Tetratricopeptide repeat-containing protein [Salegentibacter salegens]
MRGFSANILLDNRDLNTMGFAAKSKYSPGSQFFLSFLRVSLCVFFGLVLGFPVIAQQQSDKEREKAQKEARQFMQDADVALGENNFPEAEAAYRKAIAKDPENSDARYNMGNMYYTRENTPQAAQRYKQAAEVAENKTTRHKANHNLGNAYMKQKMYQEAVDAYKDALRNDPTDDETRYNLALAKKMLEEEQENQDENQDGGDDENEDQDEQDQENQDQNQDQENEDQQDQNGEGDNEGDQDQQDQEQEEQEGDQDEQEQQDGQGDQEEEQQEPEQGQPQPQPAQGQLSPEQIQSLLEAMNNEERKVQDKINAEKQKGAKVQSEKDW